MTARTLPVTVRLPAREAGPVQALPPSALVLASDLVGLWERGPRSHVLLVYYIRSAIETRDREAEAREAGLIKQLAKAANYIESAADIIRDDARGDEDDDLDAREFIAELRALVSPVTGSGAATPGGDERAMKGATDANE